MAYLGNPKNTIEVLQKYNFNFQKKFGQNFLIDTGILEEIIDSAGITKDDMILEIGPGIGTMTQYLCESARQVIAVEIDTNLIPILKDTLSEYDNVKVINDDILKVDINALAEEYNNGKPIKVVANLPYYITTPIIMGLFESHVPIDSITIMVQKEVADRMQAAPGKKDYGALSLAVQYYSHPEIVVNVPPSCFMPQPKVGSSVISLKRYEKPVVDVDDEKLMFKIIRASFNQRRKTLEIGPGIGTMTQYLCESARQVIAVEIDTNLIPILKDTLSEYDNVKVINDDILKVDINALAEEYNNGKPIKVVANLPYYITTPIIMGLFESHVPIDSITIMVQKEVADRMQAAPGKKDYGALSLAVQYYSHPEIVVNVPPSCFMPQPKVGSSVISLKRYEKPVVDVDDEKLMFKIIRASFNQRRKTLANGLNNFGGMGLTKEQIQQSIEALGVPVNVRGEALSLAQFAQLSNIIGAAK